VVLHLLPCEVSICFRTAEKAVPIRQGGADAVPHRSSIGKMVQL
jgi:hypothetical protein